MSVETTVTRAWQRQSGWLWLLLPVSWLYGVVIKGRQWLYQKGWLASYRAPIPVMVIGNITVGGSGKTPLIMALVRYLQNRGIQVGVISRGYGGDSAQMPAVVTTKSTPSVVGDEPYLIVASTNVPMAVCSNRQQAIETLLQAHPELQLIIADDGLQHYAMQRDIEWIVVDSARGFGNQQLLPTGFLREPLSRLDEATVIYHKKPEQVSEDAKREAPHPTPQLTMHLCPDKLSPLWFDDNQQSLSSPPVSKATVSKPAISKPTAPMAGSQVHAVSGIGYPQRFFDTLNDLGFEVIPHPYPDHYDFSVSELLQYTEQPIIVTSKDAVKIRALFLQAEGQPIQNPEWQALANRLWVLPVTAILSEPCYRMLDQQLTALNVLVNHQSDYTK